MNKSIAKISVVILCAGEGKRIKELAKDIPKPLLKIKALNNITILQDTINKLLSLGINKIVIVKGHLGHKIDEFINKIVQNNLNLQNFIEIIDSGTQYKSGPLYSLLSITNNEHIYKKKFIYLVIPGDTIFQFNLFNFVFTSIIDNIRLINANPLIFFKEVNINTLKKKFKEKTHGLISIAEIEKIESVQFLTKIKQKKVLELSNSVPASIIVPIFAFSGHIIKEFSELKEEVCMNTIRESINLLIDKGKTIHAIKIPKEYEFYDIDEKFDIAELNNDIR